MDLGEFYEKHKQYYYWKLSRKISGMGLIFPAEDIIHDVVVTMIADEKHRTKFERLPEPEAKAYFMSCLKHRLVKSAAESIWRRWNAMRKNWTQRAAIQK